MELAFDKIIDKVVEKTGKTFAEISVELGYKDYYLSQLRTSTKRGCSKLNNPCPVSAPGGSEFEHLLQIAHLLRVA